MEKIENVARASDNIFKKFGEIALSQREDDNV